MRRKTEKTLTPAQLREQKRWNSLRGAEVATDFLRVRGAASGQTLAGAAPLVFQGVCRKEGIRVFFTDRPKTDGRSIWLGPVDLTNPLAAVYCYGHGVHEIQHIKYTDFNAVRGLESIPLKELTNIFEDIRIDGLGAKDYQGYMLWRAALFKVYAAAGEASWRLPKKMTAPELLAKTILFYMEVKELHLTNLRDDALHLLAEARRAFGVECMKAVLAVADRASLMTSTGDAVMLAREVLAVLGDFGDRAMKDLNRFSGDMASSETESPEPSPFGDESPGLFSASGEVSPWAVPKALVPGLAEAKRLTRNFTDLCCVAKWQGASDHIEKFRQLMTPDPNSNHDQALGMQSSAFADRGDFHLRDPKEPAQARKLFFSEWNRSGALRHLFQTALEHPVPRPEMLANVGFEVDDDALALMFAGENRIFRKPVRVRGRETAIEVLLDTSGSMTDSQLALAKVAALRLLEAFRVTKGYSAAMGVFPGATSRSVSPVADWTSSIVDTALRIDFVTGYGCTPILEALLWAATELEGRTEEQKVIFVLTDGYFPESEVKGILDDLKAGGMLVVMIGIGSGSTPRGDITGKVRFANDLPVVMSKVVAQMTRRLRLV